MVRDRAGRTACHRLLERPQAPLCLGSQTAPSHPTSSRYRSNAESRIDLADAPLSRKRQLIGERAWSALFQQTPLPSTGQLFSIARLVINHPSGPGAVDAIVRAWDLAATGNIGRNDPDWTVGAKMQRNSDGRYV